MGWWLSILFSINPKGFFLADKEAAPVLFPAGSPGRGRRNGGDRTGTPGGGASPSSADVGPRKMQRLHVNTDAGSAAAMKKGRPQLVGASIP